MVGAGKDRAHAPLITCFRRARSDPERVVLEGFHALKHAMRFGAEIEHACAADPAGLGALMGLIEQVRSRNGDIRLTELSESVYNVFDILGFTHVFQIFDTEDAAVRSFGS